MAWPWNLVPDLRWNQFLGFLAEQIAERSDVPDRPDTPDSDTVYNLQIAADGTATWVAMNRPPVWIDTPTISVAVGESVAFDVSPYVSDADGDDLTFQFTETSPNISLTQVGSIVTVTGISV